MTKTVDGVPVYYESDGVSVARIRCEATTLEGERCHRHAEWRQAESDGLVCQSHRFQSLSSKASLSEAAAAVAAAVDAAYRYVVDTDEYGVPDQLAYSDLLDAFEVLGYDVTKARKELSSGNAAN